MKKPQPKLFIVRKYVMARSALEAIRKSRHVPVDDCWIDDEWKKGQGANLASAVGFSHPHEENPI